MACKYSLRAPWADAEKTRRRSQPAASRIDRSRGPPAPIDPTQQAHPGRKYPDGQPPPPQVPVPGQTPKYGTRITSGGPKGREAWLATLRQRGPSEFKILGTRGEGGRIPGWRTQTEAAPQRFGVNPGPGPQNDHLFSGPPPRGATLTPPSKGTRRPAPKNGRHHP